LAGSSIGRIRRPAGPRRYPQGVTFSRDSLYWGFSTETTP
jgi:hypothetical protein